MLWVSVAYRHVAHLCEIPFVGFDLYPGDIDSGHYSLSSIIEAVPEHLVASCSARFRMSGPNSLAIEGKNFYSNFSVVQDPEERVVDGHLIVDTVALRGKDWWLYLHVSQYRAQRLICCHDPQLVGVQRLAGITGFDLLR